MSDELTKNIGELNGSVKSYVQAKIDLAKLTFIEKSTRLTGYLLNFVVIACFVMLILGFGAAAFAVWYGQSTGNYFEGLLIAGGILLGAGILFIVLRKKIVTTSIIRNFSDILFNEPEKQN